MELLGLGVIGKNENGTERLGKVKDPSISCIMFLLPKMINSALDYLGFDQVEEKQIIREIDINFAELSDILHDEMNKCFKNTVEVKKKYNPTPKKVV